MLTLAVCWHYLSKAGLYHGFHEGLQQVKYWLSDLTYINWKAFQDTSWLFFVCLFLRIG